MIIMTKKRYYLRDDGAIFDRNLLRTLTPNEIVTLLNEFEDREFEKFVNNGW